MDDVPTLVQRATFTPVQIQQGYQMSDVDDFLDRVVSAWWAGEPLGPLVDRARFTPVRMREGYDMGEVDDFLDRLRSAPPCPTAPPRATATPAVEATDGATSGPASPGTSERPGPTPTRPAACGSPTVSSPVDAPSVIQEQRGLFSRLFGKG